jgi:hypothetical protein
VANPVRRPVMVMVTQNSGGQRTGWHDERWVEVIRYANDVLGCCVMFVGTSGESAAVEALRAAAEWGFRWREGPRRRSWRRCWR